MTADGVIGNGNELPWHIPEDLKLFKSYTMGCPVVMGRNTFESLKMPNGLPKRHNVVVSTFTPATTCDNITWANRLDVALGVAKGYGDNVFVIGGANVYTQVLEQDLVDAMYISMPNKLYEGNVFFPKVDWDKWEEVECTCYTDFVFTKYIKKEVL